MPHSDSDDFESADEGQTNTTKKDRKKRNSSSNYSDNLDCDQDAHKPQVKPSDNVATDGWDDFEIEESETTGINKDLEADVRINNEPNKVNTESSQDTGWDDFDDDWGQNEPIKPEETLPQKPPRSKPDVDIQGVTHRLAAISAKSDGWGWGWGVDTLLSSATAGISSLTSQVSQGISTVLETGIGAPNPEELARKTAKDTEANSPDTETTDPGLKPEDTSNDMTFQLGSLLSGVTKFVETTGSKVITGGLDTLETIGKKTMEVLQDGDPGLAKKRALLGLDSGDKPVLSQILREAKERAEEEDKIREAKREAKEVHYESLFDDFEGLVHLEALEMLSRQVSMRIEERLRSAEPDKRQDIKETLQQIAELCEMPEDDEDDDEEEPKDVSKEDIFHEKLQRATRDIGLKMQFQPLIKQYTDTLAWLATPTASEKAVYKRAVSCLACSTAQCVQLYHKTCEMLLVKPRRSTADEADALAQLTVVLTKHVSELATLFTERLSELPTEDKGLLNNYITNIFLEAGNSSKYIENAFQLTLPIIQIGAV